MCAGVGICVATVGGKPCSPYTPCHPHPLHTMFPPLRTPRPPPQHTKFFMSTGVRSGKNGRSTSGLQSRSQNAIQNSQLSIATPLSCQAGGPAAGATAGGSREAGKQQQRGGGSGEVRQRQQEDQMRWSRGGGGRGGSQQR